MSKNKPLPEADIDYDFYFQNMTYGDVEMEVQTLGTLQVPMGRIVICDPLVYLEDAAPLTVTIPPGAYPVKVAWGKSTDMGDRIALAKLEVTNKPTVKWELAVSEDQLEELETLEDDEYLGFPVDAGLGCFCDVQAQAQYKYFSNKFDEEHDDGNIYDDYFAELFEKNAKNPGEPGDWLDWKIPGMQNNIIMFQSGFGDGLYPAYWGYDEDGKVTSLIIDFQLLDDDESEDEEDDE